MALQDRHGPVREPLPEFGQEPRFADPRLPDQAHHLPLPRQDAGQKVIEDRQLPLPAHKGTPQPGGSRGLQALHGIGHEGFRVAWHMDQAIRRAAHGAVQQPQRGVTHQQGPRVRQRLQAHGPLRGVPADHYGLRDLVTGDCPPPPTPCARPRGR